jgi:hypothetical protein
MTDPIARIEVCLTTVQRILDALSARADHEAAFEVAKAQYAASVRASWPAGLASLADVLVKVADDPARSLLSEERDAVHAAVITLRDICNQ